MLALLGKNETKSGFLLGVLLPTLGFALLLLIFKLLENSGYASQDGFAPNFRLRTTTLLALCLNALPMRSFYAKRFSDAMYGLGAATILLAAVWVLVFQEQFFGA